MKFKSQRYNYRDERYFNIITKILKIERTDTTKRQAYFKRTINLCPTRDHIFFNKIRQVKSNQFFNFYKI